MGKHDEFDLDVRLASGSNLAGSPQPAGGGDDVVGGAATDTCHTCPTCDTCPNTCQTCPGQNTCQTCPDQTCHTCPDQICVLDTNTCPFNTCDTCQTCVCDARANNP